MFVLPFAIADHDHGALHCNLVKERNGISVSTLLFTLP